MRRFLPLLLLLGTGCLPVSAPFHLHPLAEARPEAQAIPCQLQLHFGWQNATLVAKLPDGEQCRGEFPVMSPGPAPDRSLAPTWDRVYGAGFFNAQVLGSAGHTRVFLRGDRGRTLQVEFHKKPGDPHGGLEGIALDAEGSVYKLGY